MATKKEKTWGVVIGLALGGIIANKYANQQNLPDSNKWKCVLKGSILGMASGYGFACLVGSPNDTVNYTHYNKKGIRVYEGITFANRFEKRMSEHRAKGKVFAKVIKDKPKPRIEALKLEKQRIVAFKPINNIQHNRN